MDSMWNTLPRKSSKTFLLIHVGNQKSVSGDAADQVQRQGQGLLRTPPKAALTKGSSSALLTIHTQILSTLTKDLEMTYRQLTTMPLRYYSPCR